VPVHWSTRLTGLVIVGVLAGCGGSDKGGSTKSTSTPKASPAKSALAQRVLRKGEFPGFEPQGGAPVVTDPRVWASQSDTEPTKETARLRRLGFAGAVSEHLARSDPSPAGGLSLVVQLSSPGAARTELAVQYRRPPPAGERLKPFSASGIPGVRGFDLVGGGNVGHNVVFTDGPYYYLVGAGYPTGASKPPTQAQVVAAAQTLYRRVHNLR
jgi:hypothetical protein